ncbi:MAG: hypothetical protein ACLPN6_20145 [Streptosporangiaceae bacterium]
MIDATGAAAVSGQCPQLTRNGGDDAAALQALQTDRTVHNIVIET